MEYGGANEAHSGKKMGLACAKQSARAASADREKAWIHIPNCYLRKFPLAACALNESNALDSTMY
jgi:hypothetical protein